MMDYRELENRMAKNEEIRRERDNDRLVAKALGRHTSGQGWATRLRVMLNKMVTTRTKQSDSSACGELAMAPRRQE